MVGPVSNEPPCRGLLAGPAEHRGTADAMLPVSARARSSGPEVAAPDSQRSTPDVPRVPCAPSEPETGALIQSTGESVVQICCKGPDRAGAPEEKR